MRRALAATRAAWQGLIRRATTPGRPFDAGRAPRAPDYAKPSSWAVLPGKASWVSESPRRLRVQTWLDDGEAAPTVIGVWPTADWHEREAWDMMGIRIDGHPNLKRILMEEDWEGHPLRKDYPVTGYR